MKKVTRVLSLSLCLAFTACKEGATRVTTYHYSPEVRVLLDKKSQLQLQPQPPYFVESGAQRITGIGKLKFSVSNDAIVMNERLFTNGVVEIIPSDFVSYKGRRYRGRMQLRARNGRLYLVNLVDMEAYLLSVVASEVPSSWPQAAIRAQAVAARSYAASEIEHARQIGRFYDVYADTRSQVYRGVDQEKPSISQGVFATAGYVLTHDGEVIRAYFHSSSGGRTAAADEVFGGDENYLRSVSSPFVLEADKGQHWKVSYDLAKLSKKLDSNLKGDVKAIGVVERSPSKRIKTVLILDSVGNKVRMDGNALRMALGPSEMKSTLANIRTQGSRVTIEGMGYGHGVGMGQWDAYALANSGYGYKDILLYYYRGVAIQRYW